MSRMQSIRNLFKGKAAAGKFQSAGGAAFSGAARSVRSGGEYASAATRKAAFRRRQTMNETRLDDRLAYHRMMRKM